MLVHDLQGPLGNVLSSLELMNNELSAASSETMRLMLDTAWRSSLHLKYLVDSLLDISHLEAGFALSHLTSIAVDDLVAYVCAVEEPNLEQKGITISRDVPRNLPKVWAEESMLRRVLLNLLDNALKYSRRGHVVTVRVEQEPAGDMIRFAVLDEGQGVPEAYRDLIFEKFQQVRTNSSSSGLGLGLAFCRLAVEAHGGRIWVEDAPSGGAAFCFTIPVVPDEGNLPAGSTRS
jgi:signal transduction histidine kinase